MDIDNKPANTSTGYGTLIVCETIYMMTTGFTKKAKLFYFYKLKVQFVQG